MERHWISLSERILTFQQAIWIHGLMFTFGLPVSIWVILATGGVQDALIIGNTREWSEQNEGTKSTKILENSAGNYISLDDISMLDRDSTCSLCTAKLFLSDNRKLKCGRQWLITRLINLLVIVYLSRKPNAWCKVASGSPGTHSLFDRNDFNLIQWISLRAIELTNQYWWWWCTKASTFACRTSSNQGFRAWLSTWVS